MEIERFMNYSVEAEYVLCEKFDRKTLKAMIDNFDELYSKIGKFRDFKNGYKKIEDKGRNKTILEGLYKSKKVTYKPSISCKDGRLFGANSLQGINRIVRHTLCKGLYKDYDIKGCHNTLFVWLCDKYNIKIDRLKDYNDNRETYLLELMKFYDIERDDAKTIVLEMLNGGGDTWTSVVKPLDWLLYLKIELRDAIKKICELDDFNHKYKKVCKSKDKNPEGTTINHILCKMENIVLQCMVKWCRDHNIEVATLCFDGLLVDKEIDCNEIQQYIKNELGIDLIIV